MFSGAIDLHGKTKLPAQVANHFFFGKWLKRLIGAHDLDGAYKVVCYSGAASVLAAAIQLNGLLGAWMRTKTASNVEKAEKLGWAMIRSRLMFVDLRRRQEALGQWPIQLRAVGKTCGFPICQEGMPPNFLGCPVLPLETVFSHGRQLPETSAYRSTGGAMRVAFKQAEIATDSFMMNQMLESYVQDGAATKVGFEVLPNHD